MARPTPWTVWVHGAMASAGIEVINTVSRVHANRRIILGVRTMWSVGNSALRGAAAIMFPSRQDRCGSGE